MTAATVLVGPTSEQAKQVTDLLGTDHDLAVLRQLIDNEYRDRLQPTDVELLDAVIDERRASLQSEARALADKLFAENPDSFVDRIHMYWKASTGRCGRRRVAASRRRRRSVLCRC